MRFLLAGVVEANLRGAAVRRVAAVCRSALVAHGVDRNADRYIFCFLCDCSFWGEGFCPLCKINDLRNDERKVAGATGTQHTRKRGIVATSIWDVVYRKKLGNQSDPRRKKRPRLAYGIPKSNSQILPKIMTRLLPSCRPRSSGHTTRISVNPGRSIQTRQAKSNAK